MSNVFRKLLRYLNRIINSTSFVSPFSVCPFVCCLNLNKILLLSLAGNCWYCFYYQEPVYLEGTAIKLLMSSNRHHLFYEIIHSHCYINILSSIELCIIHFTYANSNWSTILVNVTFFSIIYRGSSSCNVWNCYSCFNMYVCITIVT